MNAPLRYFYLGLFGISSRIYYRNLRICGRSNLPAKGPLMMSANHSNAFWDALMCGVFIRRHLWFLARSDVFSSPFKNKLLHAHGILPIYRLQEGMGSLEKNKEAFNTCYEFLSRGEVITIFPEGNCFRETNLRPLKKGAARIAFGAVQFNETNKDLCLLSAGLNYDDPDHLGSDLLICFSKPIYLKDYLALFNENPVIAVNRLTEDIRKQLDTVHINVQHKAHQELFFFIKKHFPHQAGLAKDKDSARVHFNRLKKLSSQFNYLYQLNHTVLFELESQVKEYRHLLKKNKLKASAYPNEKQFLGQDIFLGTLTLIIAAPLFLLGSILHFVPFKIPYLLAKKIVKQREFFTSVNMVVASLLFFLWYVLLYFMIYRFTQSFSGALISVAVSFISGMAALKYLHLFKTIREKLRWMNFRKSHPEAFHQLSLQHDKISTLVKDFMNVT